jgi:hypothetical protein
MQRMSGLLESHVLEERVDGSEARVARAGTVFANAFQVVEEKTNKGRIEVLDAELGRHFTESFFGKMQKQAEAIAISRDGMGARLALAEQAVSKEGLKKRGKVGSNHGCTSLAISRSVAS